MRYIAIPTINGEINGDPIIMKYWYKAIKYVKGEKGEYIVYKIDIFNNTIEELK